MRISILIVIAAFVSACSPGSIAPTCKDLGCETCATACSADTAETIVGVGEGDPLFISACDADNDGLITLVDVGDLLRL
ncbi:unnamed protein product [marine sediment metagenome]|uniref:EF-hand domain-containing protein n=1 Tax=marine sediment metagenome TaxID=412755 RepID=X0VLL3_9ZZZZ